MADAQHKPLSSEQITSILSQRKPKGLTTEPREIGVWYKLDHLLREQGCDNPDCKDNRPRGDAGRKIVIELNDKFMCRFCFLDGWLSPNSPNAD